MQPKHIIIIVSNARTDSHLNLTRFTLEFRIPDTGIIPKNCATTITENLLI